MPTGILTAYDLTVGVKINMDEAIYMLSPTDSPMISGVDSDGLSVLSRLPVDEIQFFWMHDEILTPRSALSAAATTGQTTITVASGDQLKFSTGDVLRIIKDGAAIGDEVIRVTGLSATTADVLIVDGGRAFSGTATNYASGDIVIGIGTALREGSDPENSRSRDRVQAHNFTQIFGPTSIEMSRTEQRVNKYGVANEFTYQTMRRMEENVIAREQAIIYGRRTNSGTTKIRTMGGLDFYITTGHDTASTQITVTTIETNQQGCFNRGGLPDRLAANPVSLTHLDDVANTSRVRQEMVDSRRGRVPVTVVWTEFGPVTIVRNRWVHPQHAFGFSREGVVRRVFDPMVMERLAKTGDADQVQLVGEESLEVKGEQHMFKMTALDY